MRLVDTNTTRAIDMAMKFPNCEVVGIDVAPIPIEPSAVPPNCQFEIDDIELGLTHFYGSCDLIHVRSLSMGLKNVRKALQDIQKCLRPGGLLIWIEPEFGLFLEDRMAYAPVASDACPNGSWTARYMFGMSPLKVYSDFYGTHAWLRKEMMRASSSVGQADFSGMETTMDTGFWEEPLFDPAT
jgi:SAM-dependent methyltransferase